MEKRKLEIIIGKCLAEYMFENTYEVSTIEDFMKEHAIDDNGFKISAIAEINNEIKRIGNKTY
jgi:hypothetical protein